MIIKCLSTSGKDVPDVHRIRGESDKTEYSPLIINNNYFVYAIQFSQNRIDFLIEPQPDRPDWYPSNIFDVIDDSIPLGFYFHSITENDELNWLLRDWGVKCILGYKSIATSSNHNIGLIERNPEDIIIFNKEKYNYI